MQSIFKRGRISSSDANHLPQTRFELFARALKTRFGSFVLPNLFASLFYVPLLVCLFFCISTYLLSGTESELLPSVTLWLSCAGVCTCLVPVGPVQCGMTLLMRAWTRNEPSSRMEVFFSGMKANWKKGLAFSFIYALLIFVAFGAGYYYLSAGSMGQGIRIVGAAFSFLMMCLVLLCRQVMYGLIVSYEVSLWGLLKNALILSIVEPVRSLGILFLRGLPSLLLVLTLALFPGAISVVFLVYVLYYLLIGFSLDGFICASFGNYLMEKYINVNIPGARVNIGLASEYTVRQKEQ